jgi:hypothetical protein
MLIDEFVDICKKGGLNLHRIAGCYFLRRLFSSYSFPLLSNVKVDKVLIDSVKWKSLLTVIKSEAKEKNTNEYILSSDNYSLEHFERKIRNRIRKSLQMCSFKRPSLEDMIIFGLQINRETLKRQHRFDRTLFISKNWNKYIKSIYSNNNMIILGSYCAEKMTGYLIVYKLDKKYVINHAYINRRDSEHSAPMNGLIFTLANQLIKENGTIELSYGLDSIKDLPELNRFKMNMMFRKIPATRFYLINPLLLPFFKITVFVLIKVFMRKNIKIGLLRELVHIYCGHRLLYKVSEFKQETYNMT